MPPRWPLSCQFLQPRAIHRSKDICRTARYVIVFRLFSIFKQTRADRKDQPPKRKMKIIKTTALSKLSLVSLMFLFSACGGAEITTAVNQTASKAAAESPTASPTANHTSPTQAGGDKVENIRGELQVGKTESVILYLGAESGDYAAYCLTNGSEAGRAIMAACKDGEQCEFSGTVDYERGCKVPGLEAELSASGKVLKVESVKSLGRKK